ncbi:MAG: hypothetical protein Q8P79_02145 [Nanoarchaeota archaeon]|nr:hypothetical protein [Nanoarchaeota archaeon]
MIEKKNSLNIEGSKYESTIGKSKFIILKKNNQVLDEDISSITNLWGIEKESDRTKDKAFAKIEETKNSLIFYGKASDIQCKTICGYPSIRIGKSPWDKRELFEIGQVKKYKKVDIFTSWIFNVTGESANFAYDVWITKNKDGELTRDDVELMVWLDKNKDFKYWGDLGNFKDFNVRYKRKDISWNNGGHVMAFIYLSKKNQRKFDLIELISHCSKKIANIGDYHIRSIELGTEFAKNTEVQIELKKAEINFIEK